MQELFQSIIFDIHDYVTYIYLQIATRHYWEWLIFFMPFFLLGELPRYILPNFILFFRHFLGLEKNDTDQCRDFLSTTPSISVLLVGYNEQDSVINAINSLLELNYPKLEIIVVDDNSNDSMYEKVLPFSERGDVKLFKNSAASGRAGRPTASNMALHIATGDFILSVDADTSFDNDILLHMIGPFYDPEVGGVAGNLKVFNINATFWSRMQSIEYALSIGLWKKWLTLLGMNIQASGAFGAFRRSALDQVGAWDPELAEDADLSLKVRKCGWKVVFSHAAIAMTKVPETLKELIGQRLRWDKGAIRTYYHKHSNAINFKKFDWHMSVEIMLEYFFGFIMTIAYAVYLVYMLSTNPGLLLFVWLISYFIYSSLSLFSIAISLYFSERAWDETPLLFSALLYPLYKGFFRWVRFTGIILETFRVNYNESYLPESAWRNTERW